MSSLLQFFEYGHLKPELREVSMPFCVLAKTIDRILPNNPEKTTALIRTIDESSDCTIFSF